MVPGARISLINNGTGVGQTATSASFGAYVFEAINPGLYTLTAESAGFQMYTALDVISHVQQNLTGNITLTPGEVTSNVVATSSVPLLQAADGSISQTITGQRSMIYYPPSAIGCHWRNSRPA